MTSWRLLARLGHSTLVVLTGLLAVSCASMIGGAGCPQISSPFGSYTSPAGEPRTAPAWGVPHNGTDFGAPLDVGTPVLAVADGVVMSGLYGGEDPFGGLRIMLSHGFDEGDKLWYFTTYQHLSDRLVRPGEQVQRGQVIARSGATGKPGRYPHLHIGVWVAPSDVESSAAMYIFASIGKTRTIYRDLETLWIDPKKPLFDPGRSYPSRPIRFTYPLRCGSS